MYNLSLFDDPSAGLPKREDLTEGVVLLRHFALEKSASLISSVATVTTLAPFRHLMIPGGLRMTVAMSNCGPIGWTSNRKGGYRYVTHDPDTDLPWPPMPELFVELACQAASEAGFADFMPDACLINRYAPGTRLSMHQDINERDFNAPIVSVSLGLPATFQLGGWRRQDVSIQVPLVHGDVLVWGGPARLRYHGVRTLKDGFHPNTGRFRINLTFRQAA